MAAMSAMGGSGENGPPIVVIKRCFILQGCQSDEYTVVVAVGASAWMCIIMWLSVYYVLVL